MELNNAQVDGGQQMPFPLSQCLIEFYFNSFNCSPPENLLAFVCPTPRFVTRAPLIGRAQSDEKNIRATVTTRCSTDKHAISARGRLFSYRHVIIEQSINCGINCEM